MQRDRAQDLDEADALAPIRDRFVVPPGVIYLDGNSLGMLPVGVAEAVADLVTRQWGVDLIRSWNKHGWMDAPQRVGDRIGAIIGAAPGEVIVADSTSVNLYKLLVAATRLRPDRTVVVTEVGNFPSDRYVIDSVAAQAGLTVRAVPASDLVAALDNDVAVVTLSHVDYRTGHLHDLPGITSAARAVGALTLWDLAHSAGVVDLNLSARGVDLAVGCGYKFLNGGPGAPAFVYVATRHHDSVSQPITGWLGHAQPFAMRDDFEPASDLRRMIVGTPTMVSLAALDAALDAFVGVSMAAVQAKGAALGDLAIDLAQQWSPDLVLASPRHGSERGSQIAFRHPKGYEIVQALVARGVIGDFREPDIIRFGLSPLTTRFVDVYDAMDHLRDVLQTGAWRDSAFAVRNAVT
jgi:kynureninase